MVTTNITTSTRTHATTAEVAADIERVTHAKRNGDTVYITDSSALAIAAQWQSPGLDGRAFAELASTGTVSANSLFIDIAEQLCKSKHQGTTHHDLVALLLWATYHPSRQES